MSTLSRALPPTAAAPFNSVSGLEQILGRLEASSNGQSPKVIGLVGCRAGDGTSFVAGALGSALAQNSQKAVLLVDASEILRCLDATLPALLEFCKQSEVEHLHQFTPPDQLSAGEKLYPSGASALERVVGLLASRFRYVLVDCGAVTVSGRLWTFASVLEQMFLIVAEGATTRNQIAYAQRLVQESGAPLTGCILNKRTYPLPERLFRALS